MSIQEDIFTALSGLVDNRVYPIIFPQAPTPTWPAIRYTLISIVPASALCGDSGDDGADTRVQLDIVTRGYAESVALRLQVMDEMRDFVPPAIHEDTFYSYDSETKTYRATLDYVIYKSAGQT